MNFCARCDRPLSCSEMLCENCRQAVRVRDARHQAWVAVHQAFKLVDEVSNPSDHGLDYEMFGHATQALEHIMSAIEEANDPVVV